MDATGNVIFWESHKIGFIAGSKISALSVLPILDWASDIAKCNDIAIMSGFHSLIEHQVLNILLHGHCGIISVLARSLYAKIPLEFQSAYNEGRVLFVSEEKQNRSSKDSAFRRNQLVANLADELVIPQISSDSSLYPIISSFSKKITIL